MKAFAYQAHEHGRPLHSRRLYGPLEWIGDGWAILFSHPNDSLPTFFRNLLQQSR